MDLQNSLLIRALVVRLLTTNRNIVGSNPAISLLVTSLIRGAFNLAASVLMTSSEDETDIKLILIHSFIKKLVEILK